jgi:FKBP-type peptidyl-prolyl cis-trans isomerase
MIKRTVFVMLLTIAAAVTCAAGGKKDDSGAAPAPSSSRGDRVTRDTSYAIGMWVGMSIVQEGMKYDFDYTELLNGIRDVVGDRELRLTTDEAIALMQTAHAALQTRLAEENQRQGEAFLAENSKRDGVSITASGLQYEVLIRGTGEQPVADDTVYIHYELSLVDGTVLESSFEMEEPVELPLGSNVIPGFTEGVQLMPVGSTYMLYIPAALGYGERGGGGLPPNATLIFKIELVSIVY